MEFLFYQLQKYKTSILGLDTLRNTTDSLRIFFHNMLINALLLIL